MCGHLLAFAGVPICFALCMHFATMCALAVPQVLSCIAAWDIAQFPDRRDGASPPTPEGTVRPPSMPQAPGYSHSLTR